MTNENLKNYYRQLFNKISNTDELHYLVITPPENISLKQFSFLLKKSMRDISKHYNINHSHQYIKYLSVVEVSSKITQSWKNVENLHLHSHLIIDMRVNLFNIIELDDLIKQIHQTFLKQEIRVNIYNSNDLYYLSGLREYHTKQFEILDEKFIKSNLNI